MLVVTAIPATATAGGELASDAPTVPVYYDGVVDGEVTGGIVLVPVDGTPASHGFRAARSVTLQNEGPSSNRIDVVIVGEGYTAAEMSAFQADTVLAIDAIFAPTPFKEYRDAFNVHRVDVASNESGVDHDPTFGVMRDTAFDGGFWCGDPPIERLLCVDTVKVRQAAAAAPSADVIVVLVNTATYGGAGYADVLVAAGRGSSMGFLLQHEGGHTFGDLSDEYYYADTTWTGGEMHTANCSSSSAASMTSGKDAWYRWLGYSNPTYNGRVGTYEGCRYTEFGLYRPTGDSIMRTAGLAHFNAPSIEALLVEFYRLFDPVDTPAATQVHADSVITLPVVASESTMRVVWMVDGIRQPRTGTSLDLAPLGLGSGSTVTATVTDFTPWVRNSANRRSLMRATLTYTTVSTNCNGLTPTIVGTAADETINGTESADIISGLGGNDIIFGNGGDDIICGGPGNDIIDGLNGDDTVFGGPGNDRIGGQLGDDTLNGGTGKDTLRGGPGNDDLIGAAGNDTISGQKGVDYLSGGAGNDRMAAHLGADILEGGDGDDTLRGGPGDDILRGRDDDDTLFGQDGDDILLGQSGDDVLDGGTGSDRLRGGDHVLGDVCGNGPNLRTCEFPL